MNCAVRHVFPSCALTALRTIALKAELNKRQLSVTIRFFVGEQKIAAPKLFAFGAAGLVFMEHYCFKITYPQDKLRHILGVAFYFFIFMEMSNA